LRGRKSGDHCSRTVLPEKASQKEMNTNRLRKCRELDGGEKAWGESAGQPGQREQAGLGVLGKRRLRRKREAGKGCAITICALIGQTWCAAKTNRQDWSGIKKLAIDSGVDVK